MKKVILTLVGMGMFVSQLLAYSHNTEATFTASEDRVIRVIIDGRIMNRKPQHHVQIRDIRPGEHRVQLQVFGRGGKRALVTDNVYLRRGYKSKFRLQRYRRNRLKLYRAGVQPIDYSVRYPSKWENGNGKKYHKNRGKHKGDGHYRNEQDHYSCGVDEYDNYHRREREHDRRNRRRDYNDYDY